MKIALIVHGFPPSPGDNLSLKNLLTRRNYKPIEPNWLLSSFALNLKDVVGYLVDSLGGLEPGVIIGISVGGLIAPFLAQKYPHSRLILVATGARFSPPSRLVRAVIQNQKLAPLLIRISPLIPSLFWYRIYRLLNPSVTSERKTRENIDAFIANLGRIPPRRVGELIRLIKKIDNEQVLSRLENPTLILASQNDLLVPRTAVVALSQKIKKSQLHFTATGHFAVLSRDSLAIVDKFL